MLIVVYLLTIQCALCSTVNEEPAYLLIEPVSSREYGLIVVKRVEDTLNLTCSVFHNSTDTTNTLYNMSWIIPRSSYNSKNHFFVEPLVNSVNLVVLHLEARDEGEYICTAHPMNRHGSQYHLTKVVKVNVKNRKKGCSEAQFNCSVSKVCIPQRYKCDGHKDCQFGEDEDMNICGDPCLDKLKCEYALVNNSIVRCIPKSWCCNFKTDINCTTKEPLSCCPALTFSEERAYYPIHSPRYNDVTFLQTTVYTVIGCCIVLMIVVTVVVITICRLHMKRTLMNSQPSTTHLPQPIQNTSPYDLDIYLNQGCLLDSLNSSGFFVTYNINHGVQIVGHAVDPPPYSEVICVPPKEGPPPPYCSCETLDQPETEALLQQPNSSQDLKKYPEVNRTDEENISALPECSSLETNSLRDD